MASGPHVEREGAGATMSPRAASSWPALPFAHWQDTHATLHMWLQIVGKTRLALAPVENHWWQVALYVTPRGLTTSSMPHGERTFAVDFDFVDHSLAVRCSDGASRVMALTPRSVAQFHEDYTALLRSLDLQVAIMPRPVEIATAIPFADDREHASYDPDAVHCWWQLLVQADRVLKAFRAEFVGKASPVHFFWGSFDLAVTRFSGREAPRHPGAAPNCPDYVMVEAYSHECSSCGFWPGGGGIPAPAFYAYAYPEPPGYAEQAVTPAGAYYDRDLREFILPVEAIRSAAQADEHVLDFLRATYAAAADLAGWNRAALERPPGFDVRSSRL